MEQYIIALAQKAKEAAPVMALQTTGKKNTALQTMANALRAQKDEIIAANEKDMEAGRTKGLSKALLDRLLLNNERIEAMAQGLESLIQLADPIGETIAMWRQPNGLEIGKKRVPFGVIAMIYEARPNVTVDAAGLALKTGNALILKGGSEAFESNKCLAHILQKAVETCGLPSTAIQLVETTDREAVSILLKQRQYIDVVIPRGGAGLIQFVVNHSAVPAIETDTGNCHVYIDKYGEIPMGVNIVFNAKTQRPAVCNAMETLLVHKDIAAEFLPALAEKLREKPVELRGCQRTCAILKEAVPAT